MKNYTLSTYPNFRFSYHLPDMLCVGIINIPIDLPESPFNYQRNDLLLSVANYHQYSAGISIYHKLNKQFGFSFSRNYRHDGGLFTNVFTGKKADAIQALGGRARLEWHPNNRWRRTG